MRFCSLFLLLLTLPIHAQERTAVDTTLVSSDSVSAAEAVSRVTRPSDELGDFNAAYYVLDALNEGVPASGDMPNRMTPQASLEHFVRSARAGDFEAAARILNLNLFPTGEQARLAPILAEQLFYVMDRQVGMDWEALPDRPDGANDQGVGQSNPMLGQPRRSIRFGAVTVDERDVAFRMQRVRVGDQPPIWVMSPQTVENAPVLYDRFGPGPIDRAMPDWARAQFLDAALWTWLALLAGLLVLIGVAWGVSAIVERTLAKSDSMWLSEMADRVATPVAVLVAGFAFWFVASVVLAMPRFLTTTLLIGVIIAFVWATTRAISAVIKCVVQQQDVEELQDLSTGEKSDMQRQLTYLSVGRRVLLFVVVVFATGLIVSQFASLEQFGFSLMASAGVATILLGIAAQPVLGNIIASIQIGLAKPVRIGDSVSYEGTWGYVEDITYTYLLIKSWDKRRLVVPLRYFITHPFENWTKRDAHLIKPIYFHADYTIDVGKVRDKFDELLRASDLWDEEEEPNLIVVGATDETIKLRATCSASNASDAWTLHCELREQLIAFVRDLNDGAHLPRRRLVMTEMRGGSDA